MRQAEWKREFSVGPKPGELLKCFGPRSSLLGLVLYSKTTRWGWQVRLYRSVYGSQSFVPKDACYNELAGEAVELRLLRTITRCFVYFPRFLS